MIRLGAIGAGMVFRRYEAAVGELKDVAITAVADTDSAHRASASAPGRRIFRTAEELLDEPLDAVLVLTSNSAHVEVVKACLSRGLAVFCEKPLATTADAARQLVDLARAKSVFLFPAMHCRYRPEVRYLRDYCRDSVVSFEHMWHEDWRHAPAWYRDPVQSGGGVLLDVGINQIDWLWRLVGPMEAQSARIRTSDRGVEHDCWIDLRFPGGAGTASLSWQGIPERRRTRITTFASETFELDHDLRRIHHDGRTHGPWNDDEYAGTISDFLAQLHQPAMRDPGAGESVVALLSLIGGIYARQGLDFSGREPLPAGFTNPNMGDDIENSNAGLTPPASID